MNSISLTHVSREHCETLGFALACLYSAAVSLDEFRQWAQSVVEKLDVDSTPLYMFDLMELEDPLAAYEVIGFTPFWECSEDEDRALLGLAVGRGRNIDGTCIPQEEALNSLKRHPHIEEIFRLVFPFVGAL